MNCKHCGSSEVNEDRRRGDTVCMNCGAVLEEGMIVNEVEFQENAAGASHVIGQFMSNDAPSFLPGSANLASKLGFQRESRQLTLNNAKRRLQEVGNRLRLTQHQIEMAFNFYRTTLTRGWTRGRKINYVIAACLYIVCRTEGTHHMLLDLSDLLEVNVYVLGRSYTEIAKRLCINIPALDPCLYIQRFAQKLEFADKSREVENTAMRLLQRMKKDWIAVGRRPAGLAASALLVAGRLHNYNRTVEDVARIAKISEQTARKRLQEFARTPSSSLTIEEFLNVDYEEEHDPPAFLESLKRPDTKEEDLDRMCQEVSELESLIDKEMEKLQERRARGAMGRTAGDDVTDPASSAASSAAAAAAAAAAAGGPGGSGNGPQSLLLNTDDAEVNLSEKYILKDALEGVVNKEELDSWVNDLHQVVTQSSPAGSNELQQQKRECAGDVDEMMAAVGIVRPHASATNQIAAAAQPISKEAAADEEQDGQLSLEGIDDAELEREYILSNREVLIKARDWYRRNAEYLKWAEERRNSSNGKSGADKKPRRRPKRTAHVAGIHTTEQAIEHVIKSKKALSSKINYEALKRLTEPQADADAASQVSAAAAAVESQVTVLPTVTVPPSAATVTKLADQFTANHDDVDEDEEFEEAAPSVMDMLKQEGAGLYGNEEGEEEEEY